MTGVQRARAFGAPKAARPMHRIVFVTGKGGVGKSAVAAATALQFARAGQRVLLVELGSRSFYGPWLGLPADTRAVPWQPRIGIALWDVESALREYIGHYLVFKAAARSVLNNAVMKALVAAAPSVAELAILGQLTAPMRHGWYKREVDTVVVDAHATGQFMALLRAPRGLSNTVASGAMHRHTSEMSKLLADPAICAYRIVTMAEEMPISEACEMAGAIRAETGLAADIICNRLIDLPPRLPPLAREDPGAPFVAQMARVARRQRDSLAALEALGADRAGSVRRLPLVPTTDARRLTEALADALEAGAGAAT
ncbi:MAG: hypothetical protein KA151_10795 [Piscinibacter sp.]|nr:hypothetical protein [Piscinibacter sp.]